jgi:hypothetical protein
MGVSVITISRHNDTAIFCAEENAKEQELTLRAHL